jgi:outer membrane protein OmpA-like peptidoglycan-associated protein
MPSIRTACLIAALLAGASPAIAQSPDPAPAAGPAPLVVHFDTGSTSIRTEDTAVLDKAARAYSEGKPLVMILTGTADRVGGASINLSLSQQRATAVLKALLDRGIPAERFQILAKGQTELAVPTDQGVAEAENRRVEITWR